MFFSDDLIITALLLFYFQRSQKLVKKLLKNLRLPKIQVYLYMMHEK